MLKTLHYTIRPVQTADALALLRCYNDPEAVRRMNSDNCQGTFLMTTEDNVLSAIRFWQNDPCLDRLSLISIEENTAVGTAELHFKEEAGVWVLRLDLCSAHEKTDCITELVNALCEEGFERFPEANSVVIKAFPQDEARLEALKQCGFTGEMNFLGFDHYYEKQRPFRGVAVCGLVCKYCSERTGCAGCKRVEQPDYPCEAGSFTSLRINAFAAYAREYGAEKLLAHLDRKAKQGVQYHRNGVLGDYDGFATAEELIAFLEN